MAIRGLIAKPEHNGRTGRVLRHVKKSGRYGVRLPEGDLLAIKRANLEPLVPAEGADSGRERRIAHLLDMPADVLECLLRHFSARSFLRISATCVQLTALCVALDDSPWDALLAHPLIAP